MEKYIVYLHYGENEEKPFYIGASSNMERPYNFTSRSKEWINLYEGYEKKIRVIIINVDSREEAERLENQLIIEHKHSVCNEAAAALLPMRMQLLPTAQKVLEVLGDNIRLARLRRNLTTSQICERAGISRPTYHNIENGDPSVSMGSYVSVLFVMSLEKEFLSILQEDPIGRRIQDVTLISSKSRSK